MSNLLTKKQAINKLKQLGFTQSTFEEWEQDSLKDNYKECEHFDPFEVNFNNLLKKYEPLSQKKYYIIGITRGKKDFQIRAWGMY